MKELKSLLIDLEKIISKCVTNSLYNENECKLFYPGIWFHIMMKHSFRYLREHSERIFEVPKRDKKKNLYVQRFKGNK